jgi:hypothetical protein
MHYGRFALTIFACLSLCIFTESIVRQAFGVQKKSPVPSIGVKTIKGEPAQKSSSKISSTDTDRPPKTFHKSPRQEPPTQLKPMRSKVGSHVKVQKKVVPKAVVEPRTDLMYYGVLEDPQRYDPRPNPRQAGVPNPQNSDLSHDHFQELDRNQDGMIDPVERAFGRIDMDRDLHTRTLQ